MAVIKTCLTDQRENKVYSLTHRASLRSSDWPVRRGDSSTLVCLSSQGVIRTAPSESSPSSPGVDDIHKLCDVLMGISMLQYSSTDEFVGVVGVQEHLHAVQAHLPGVA